MSNNSIDEGRNNGFNLEERLIAVVVFLVGSRFEMNHLRQEKVRIGGLWLPPVATKGIRLIVRSPLVAAITPFVVDILTENSGSRNMPMSCTISRNLLLDKRYIPLNFHFYDLNFSDRPMKGPIKIL